MVHHIWDDFPDIQQALVKVKNLMTDDLRGMPNLIAQHIRTYIDAPGKYLRAGLLLLVATEREDELVEARYYLAAALELFHLATLIHDDVIDMADYRRGVPALQQQTSNRLAIYSGDYLLARAGRLMGQGLHLLELKETPQGLKKHLIEGVLAGEIRQLLNQHNPQMTLKDYLKQIQGKTALLFALACQGGTLSRHSRAEDLVLAYQAGRDLGMAFQLADDLLDLEQPLNQSGKPQFQDVQNGIYTAPVLLAKAERPDLSPWLMTKKIEAWTAEDLQYLVNVLQDSQALERTRQLKQAYLTKSENRLLQLGLSRQTVQKILKKI